MKRFPPPQREREREKEREKEREATNRFPSLDLLFSVV